MTKVIRIALADHSVENADMLKRILTQITHYRLIFEAYSGQELLNKLVLNPVDLVLMNGQIPFTKGAECLSQLRIRFPDLSVILVALYDNPLILSNYLNRGVNGLLLKHFDRKLICQTIDGVIQKGYYCSESIMASVSRFYAPKKKAIPIAFSETELKIIRCICLEMKSAVIAIKLFRSVRTIDWHRNEIKKKMGVKSTIGMVKYAMRNGLFSE